jgi:thiol:disulfide interchange protein DsbA
MHKLFGKRTSVLLIASLAVLTFATASAATPDIQEGKDYLVIQGATESKSEKIEVTEFFSYQCPHCFAFSKPLHDWSLKLPNDVQFGRESVSIGHEAWVPIARTYYVLRDMGKLDELDEKIFNAIHQQRLRLTDMPYIMGWLNQQKIPLNEFDVAYRGAKAREAYERGTQLSMQYKIPSIPVMVIDGKYMVVIESNVDFAKQLGVVDKLIERVRVAKRKGGEDKTKR